LSKNKMTLDPYINYAININQTQETIEHASLSDTMTTQQMGGKYKRKRKGKRTRTRILRRKSKQRIKFKKTNKRTYRKKN
jgi:hypothetical protein